VEKRVIGNQTYYCFTENELPERRVFEEGLMNQGIVDRLVIAVLAAIREASSTERQSWKSARMMLMKFFPEFEDAILSDADITLNYDHMVGGFQVAFDENSDEKSEQFAQDKVA
jgi:hypothetical protein